MKRGKSDEKMVGPLFPRLHVNDTTEKGGPRAPPRNKMALYEQFTVPFQKFKPNSNSSSNAVPLPPSSSLGPERSHIFPTYRAESYVSHQSDGANSDTSLAQLEQRKKVYEDDSRAYGHSRTGQSNDKTLKSCNGKKLTSMGSRNFCCSVAGQNDGDKDQTQFGSPLVEMRKDVRSEGKGHLQVSASRQQPTISVKNTSTGEVIDSPVRQAKVIPDQEDQHCPVSNIIRLHQGDACLQQECITGSQSNDIEHGDGLLDSTMDMCNRNTHVITGCFHSTMNQSSPFKAANGTEYYDTRNGSPTQKGSSDESDDLSKISTVENVSSLELSPDGIAKILGQKLFWRARRKITNQQSAFAVQVFELHRLIKVQQQIAGSPDLLLEAAAFLGKFPLEGSTPKSLSLEVVIEPQPQNLKQQDHSEKPNHEMECSAENAIGKTSFPCQKNGSHLSNYTLFNGNPHQANVVADDRMGSRCFDPSPGHQWLIPVMSPSEGLVYKPYPTPFGQGPLDVTFMNPAYGIPYFHQAIAVSPYNPPGSYAYFPPHGAPAMNQSASVSVVKQVNQSAAQGSHGQNGHSHSSLEVANFNTHNQNSCNLPNQKNGATKFQASKKRELQGSTASSPSEMVQGIRTKKFAEGRVAHSPSLAAPLVLGDVLQSLGTRQHTQVIKVVPHNPRSATESAARIFQSIQEERKQSDFV